VVPLLKKQEGMPGLGDGGCGLTSQTKHRTQSHRQAPSTPGGLAPLKQHQKMVGGEGKKPLGRITAPNGNYSEWGSRNVTGGVWSGSVLPIRNLKTNRGRNLKAEHFGSGSGAGALFVCDDGPNGQAPCDVRKFCRHFDGNRQKVRGICPSRGGTTK